MVVAGKQLVQCNISPEMATALATPLVYDGVGVSYKGQSLTNPGGRAPLYLGTGTPVSVLPGRHACSQLAYACGVTVRIKGRVA